MLHFSLQLFVFVHVPPIFSVLLTYSLKSNSLLFWSTVCIRVPWRPWCVALWTRISADGCCPRLRAGLPRRSADCPGPRTRRRERPRSRETIASGTTSCCSGHQCTVHGTRTTTASRSVQPCWQVTGRHGCSNVERLHRERRRVTQVTRVLYMAQEQRQHLDRFSRVGRSPDDTAALTWNDCIGNHVVLLRSPVYCTRHKNNDSIAISSAALAGHRTTRPL